MHPGRHCILSQSLDRAAWPCDTAYQLSNEWSSKKGQITQAVAVIRRSLVALGMWSLMAGKLQCRGNQSIQKRLLMAEGCPIHGSLKAGFTVSAIIQVNLC